MRRSSPFAVVVLFVLGCVTPATPPPSLGPAASPPATAAATHGVSAAPGASASGGPAEGWTTDISRLVPRMDALHPKLDHGVPLAELNAAAADLSTQTAMATDDQLLDGVMRIVALVSRAGCDAHTGAY